MIIAVASQKGGSGKSLVTCNLAVCFAHAGEQPLIVDTDPQQSLKKWAVRREKLQKKYPTVDCAAEDDTKKILSVLPTLAAQRIVLIDMPGIDARENRYLLTAADVVVAPFKPTQADLDTLPTVASWFKSIRAKPFYLINEASTLTSRDKIDARALMQANGAAPARTVLHSRTAYKDCVAMGMGVVEMQNAKAAGEFTMLFEEFRSMLRYDRIIPDRTQSDEVIQ